MSRESNPAVLQALRDGTTLVGDLIDYIEERKTEFKQMIWNYLQIASNTNTIQRFAEERLNDRGSIGSEERVALLNELRASLTQMAGMQPDLTSDDEFGRIVVDAKQRSERAAQFVNLVEPHLEEACTLLQRLSKFRDQLENLGDCQPL